MPFLKYLLSQLKYLIKRSYVLYSYKINFSESKIKSVIPGIGSKVETPIKVGENVTISINTEIGRYSVIMTGCEIQKNTIRIGSFCSIASNCIIGPNHHPLDKLSTSAVFYSESWGVAELDLREKYNSRKKTLIGNDVWIGANSVILGGVNIGNGSIIGAGSVVTKNVEPYSIVAGVPAKFIKYRFNENYRTILNNSNWWDLNIQDIYQLWSYPNITQSINYLKKKVEKTN